MANHNSLSLLESLPQDLLGEILSRVADSSREEISQCLTVSRTLSSAVQDDRVLNSLHLRSMAMNPLITYGRYHDLMERCLRSGNAVAHYIEGIKMFFVQDSTEMGLFHLKKSADGDHDNGRYLCGVLKLLTGARAEGRMLLRPYVSRSARRRNERCWRENMFALRNVVITMKDDYTINLNRSVPPINCHANDMENYCQRCYHYKQMRRFFAFIQFGGL